MLSNSQENVSYLSMRMNKATKSPSADADAEYRATCTPLRRVQYERPSQQADTCPASPPSNHSTYTTISKASKYNGDNYNESYNSNEQENDVEQPLAGESNGQKMVARRRRRSSKEDFFDLSFSNTSGKFLVSEISMDDEWFYMEYEKDLALDSNKVDTKSAKSGCELSYCCSTANESSLASSKKSRGTCQLPSPTTTSSNKKKTKSTTPKGKRREVVDPNSDEWKECMLLFGAGEDAPKKKNKKSIKRSSSAGEADGVSRSRGRSSRSSSRENRKSSSRSRNNSESRRSSSSRNRSKSKRASSSSKRGSSSSRRELKRHNSMQGPCSTLLKSSKRGLSRRNSSVEALTQSTSPPRGSRDYTMPLARAPLRRNNSTGSMTDEVCDALDKLGIENKTKVSTKKKLKKEEKRLKKKEKSTKKSSKKNRRSSNETTTDEKDEPAALNVVSVDIHAHTFVESLHQSLETFASSRPAPQADQMIARMRMSLDAVAAKYGSLSPSDLASSQNVTQSPPSWSSSARTLSTTDSTLASG